MYTKRAKIKWKVFQSGRISREPRQNAMEKPQKIKSTRFARANLDYSFVLCLSWN